MNFMLDIPTGQGGGVKQCTRSQKYPRTVIVTVSHQDTANAHAAFFARSRRELIDNPIFGQKGIAIVVGPAVAATTIPFPVKDTVNTNKLTSYSTIVLEAYAGELWACADLANTVNIDVFDSAAIEV